MDKASRIFHFAQEARNNVSDEATGAQKAADSPHLSTAKPNEADLLIAAEAFDEITPGIVGNNTCDPRSLDGLYQHAPTTK
jgi:hypothetical protein